jgi:hypothetical protein
MGAVEVMARNRPFGSLRMKKMHSNPTGSAPHLNVRSSFAGTPVPLSTRRTLTVKVPFGVTAVTFPATITGEPEASLQ